MKRIIVLFLLFLSAFLGACSGKKDISEGNKNTSNVSDVDNDLKVEDEEIKDVLEKENNVIDDKNDVSLEKKLLENDTTDLEKNNDVDFEKEKDLNSNKNKLSLSDIDLENISNPRECLKLGLSRASDKIECIKKVEYDLLNSPKITLDTCKNILTKKNKIACFDKLYFSLSLTKHKEKYCSLIKNEQMKITCRKNILDYKNSLKKIEIKQEEEQKKTGRAATESANYC